MSNNNNANGDIGVVGMLGLLFVGLKLGGVIDWSWWYVTLPFWGGLGLAFAILLFVGMCALAVGIVKAILP